MFFHLEVCQTFRDYVNDGGVISRADVGIL